MSEPLQVQINLNGDAVVAPAQRAITICTQLFPVALGAINGADLNNPPEVEGVFWKMEHPPHADVESVREHFKQWLIAKALQELARGVRGALEEAAKYVWAFRQGGKIQTLGEFNAGLADEERRVNGRNFPQLLEEVNAGLTAPFEFMDEYLSLQRARSCLEHQDGVVLPRHLDPNGDQMTLRMPRFEAWAIDLDPPRQIDGPMELEKESRVEIRPGIWQLSFAVGERITITPPQLLMIAQGCFLFVQDLASKLPRTEE